MIYQLRKHQQRCMDKIKNRYEESVHDQLVKMPTGTGKTPLLASIPKALGFNKRCLYIAHREELVTQLADKLRVWNPGRSVGIEMADSSTNADLVAASVQTIGRKGSPRLLAFDPNDIDLVAIDEAHHVVSASYLSILDHFGVRNRDEHNRILNIGVTATVNRTDGRGYKGIYEEIVFDMSMLDAVREGWIVEPRGQRVSTQESLDGVDSSNGDFQSAPLSKAVNTPRRNALAVKAWVEHGGNRQTIGFCVDVQHCKDLAAMFVSKGIKAEAVWGDDPDRKDKLARHRAGEIRVLLNCQLLTEGYDDWQIGCILFARPTKSEVLYTQVLGRGTRLQYNISNIVEARLAGTNIIKHDCIVIDLVDNTTKHSLVTISSLYGLGDMDLKKKPMLEVLEEVAKLKAKNPDLDVSNCPDLDSLKTYAEEIDLFKQNQTPPEIIEISGNSWVKRSKTAEPVYDCFLPKGDYMMVMPYNGQWVLKGRVMMNEIYNNHPSLRDAIEEGDYKIKSIGGKQYAAVANRDAAWTKKKPNEAQLKLAKKIGLNVPNGVSSGELAKQLNNVIKKKQKL